MRVLALWTLVCLTWALTCSLKLAAFNVQVFGQKKADDPDVMKYVAKIAARYDIILIQEIRDNTDTTITKLMMRIRRDENVIMKLEISKREGRTFQKEQYAFLYREDLGVSVLRIYGDNPPWKNLFERPPFVVRFCYPNGGDVTLVGLHSKPSDAVKELQALSRVYNTVRDVWNTTDIIILGDLNADVPYVKSQDWKDISIRQDTKTFYWPIGDDAQTSVKTGRAYDRFVIAGKKLRAAVKPNSAKPFNFTSAYTLTNKQTLKVSDHYPIELELKANGRRKSSAMSCNTASGQASVFDILSTFGVLGLSFAVHTLVKLQL